MARFELTIDPSYVPHWTIQDALRELLQNALDESVINSDNSMSVTRKGNLLSISTKNARLTKSSLLIGASSKRGDTTTIGKEGEGYKLACLVLARAGHRVTIHNYAQGEKWTPKIINSKRYGGKLLVMDVEKFFWTTPPDHDLTFEINGITNPVYEEVKRRTLFLRDEYINKLINQDIGEILLDQSESGRVYVNGLYVSTMKDGIEYGYNLRPSNIELDRDRRTVSDFNLTWETSNLWSNFQNRIEFKELIRTGKKDVQYVDSHYINKDIIHSDFQEEFGKDSFPVTNQSEYEHVKGTYKEVKPIIVNETRCKLVKNSDSFRMTSSSFVTKKKEDTPTELLIAFKEKHNFSDNVIKELDTLIELSKDW